MSCLSFLRCRPARNQDPANSPGWRTPQWPEKEEEPWTYSRMHELEDEDDTPPPSPRTPRHRTRRPTASILKERRDWRPISDLPVRNPGISVLPEKIPLLFPSTPGNGRPRSFVDPNPVVGETLANALPTPLVRPINPWVGNSFVTQSLDGSGRSMLCTPLTTPGGLPPSSRPPINTITPASMVAPLPPGMWTAASPGAWVHMRNLPITCSISPAHPASSFATPFRQSRQIADNDDDDGDDDGSDDAPVIPPVIPNTPSSLRTPRTSRTSASRLPSSPFPIGTRLQGIPTPTGTWLPVDQLGWEPHPCPDPMMHADAFWTPHPFSVPRRYWTPSDYASMLRLTGGVPAPGTAPGWVSPIWPMHAASPTLGSMSLHLNPTLTPNPNNAWFPHLVWDVSEHPDYAKRITGRNITVSLDDRLDQPATFPESPELQIYVDHHLATTAFWGPILVKNKKGVTVDDVLLAVFNYLQKPLRQEEYDYLVNLDPDNSAKMCDSFQQRCLISRNQLPLFERQQGIRRIDTFGDKKRWWGVWVTQKLGNASYLNLGLVDTQRVRGTF